eukprot:6349041-Pyramimonas_sp.AAC.1
MLPNGLRARVEIVRTPLLACWGGTIRANEYHASLSRVCRARISNFFQNLHRRREGAVIVVGVISVGAVTGCPVVA